jgi:hypothetical protein
VIGYGDGLNYLYKLHGQSADEQGLRVEGDVLRTMTHDFTLGLMVVRPQFVHAIRMVPVLAVCKRCM